VHAAKAWSELSFVCAQQAVAFLVRPITRSKCAIFLCANSSCVYLTSGEGTIFTYESTNSQFDFDKNQLHDQQQLQKHTCIGLAHTVVCLFTAEFDDADSGNSQQDRQVAGANSSSLDAYSDTSNVV